MGTLPRAVGIPVSRTFTVYRGGGYRYHIDLIIISSGRFSWVIYLNGVPLVLPHQNLVISFYSCSEYFFYICNWTCVCFAIADISSSWHRACHMAGAQSMFLE